MNLKKTLLLLAFIVFGGNANAGLIVDQSFNPANIITGANFSQGSSSIFDDFTILDAANVQEISMWGGYWTSGVQPASFDFRIQIRSSANASDVVFDALVTAFNVSDTGFNHNNSQFADILRFDFNVAGLMLNAGSYFIGISSQNTLNGTNFYWQRTDISSLNGNISAFGNNLTTSSWGNHALAISSTTASVPEPSSFAVMMLGLFGFVMRKKILSK
ncbi:PEP-CTERM sorting domain-containing protein [Rheinheimera baltica]|uniref:PEP-CTERM sorting domain-containing protein n=1 Tax=Rheinheimera baltica TaxID=67576 RepID=A0ABT9HZM0_9GAMM|nr:PEP-CTERM sorting domain-containing protein [Rheinheimera baltica]MDP5136585.1 PEP-CTERM sorting domain-containing protein [Rheinheimera baltica]MDP5189885.1 PEP-CTERM sorting domain-containing protein [Rheinheimera baltica]